MAPAIPCTTRRRRCLATLDRNRGSSTTPRPTRAPWCDGSRRLIDFPAACGLAPRGAPSRKRQTVALLVLVLHHDLAARHAGQRLVAARQNHVGQLVDVAE